MRASRKFYFGKLRTSAVQHLHEDLVALNPVVAVVPVANTEGLCRDTPTEKERKKERESVGALHREKKRLQRKNL